jgi:hypothetical protein
MNTLWPYIAPFFWPTFAAYFFSGVYYIIRDVSEPIHRRPSYLSSPSAISVVGVFWFPILLRVLWKSWHRNPFHDFMIDVRKEAIPTLAVFSVLTLDFMYIRSRFL